MRLSNVRLQPRWLLRLVAAGLVVASAAIMPSTAAARYSSRKSVWGSVRDFPLYAQLGVSLYQYAISWNSAAPTRPHHPQSASDPAYHWPAELNQAIAQARKYHMSIAVMVVGAPGWANGGHGWQWPAKRPSDYANFMVAAAHRYPSVHKWMIWGEPDRLLNFQPEVWARNATRLTGTDLRAVRTYARMLDAAYRALKRVSRKNLVIGGMTLSSTDIPADLWVKYMRLPNGKRPRLDAWGHNPFTTRKPNLRDPKGGRDRWDFSNLARFAKIVNKAFKRKVPLFLSEWKIPTAPESEFNYHVSETTQADWIRAGFRIIRHKVAGSRILTLGWVTFRDNPPNENSGLLRKDGSKKPGFYAFQNAT